MEWDYNKFSYFRIAQTTLMVFMMIFGIPLMTRKLKYSDSVIILIGTISHIASRIIFMTVEMDFLFYLAIVVGSLGLVVGPTFRSMVSKLIASTERGRVFSLLSMAEYSVPLYSGIMFTQVYNLTVNLCPSAFFLVTISSQLLIFLIVLVIYLRVPKDMLIYKEPEEKTTIITATLPENETLIDSH